MPDTELFAEFNPLTKEDWRANASKALKDKPLTALNSAWYGLTVAPYYTVEDLAGLDLPSPVTTRPANLINYVTIKVADAATANKQALQAMNLGATGIVFNLTDKTAFDNLLKDIGLQHCAIGFSGEIEAKDYLGWLAQANQNSYQGFVNGAQCWQQQTATGFYPTVIGSPDENELAELSGILSRIYQLLLPVAEADAGACLNNMAYRVQMGTNYFFGIAKIRALRLVLHRLYAAYKINRPTGSFHIIAASPPWQNQAYEPHENMLKATTAAMAAIIGGADALIISPGYDDAQEELVARNISTLLSFESYLGKTADPAAGAYFLENLTHAIVTRVWADFKERITS